MAYQSLYRRFRPGRFDQIIGQDHLVRALRNAARDDRVGHAYLLSGPRGTGKTTAARVLAKVLNCENVVDGEPCDECDSCRAIDTGRSFDLHELDAASHNKVDDVRDLLSKVALGTPGRTKVYLLDEVHMLTAGAENALLKTLEEPPDHVVFVLATTEPHKVVETVRSRTQHLELNLVGAEQMTEHIRWVAEQASLEVDDADIAHVVQSGRGSVRDALSALDRVVAAGGASSEDHGERDLVEALAAADTGAALAALARSIQMGSDVRVIGERLVVALRDVFLVTMGGPTPHLAADELEHVTEVSQRLRPARVTAALELLGVALVDMRQSPDPRIDLEVALVRATKSPSGGALDGDAAATIEALEARVAALEASDPTSPAAAAPAPTRGSEAPTRTSVPDPPTAPAPPSTKNRDKPAARGGPADEARRRLAQSTGRGERRTREHGGTEPSPPDANVESLPPKPAPNDAAPRPADAPEQVEVAPASADAVLEPVESAPAPVVDDPVTPSQVLTLDVLGEAWSASLLGSLSNRARARYQAGRFVGCSDDVVTYALPNEIHRRRCEEVADEVADVVGSHFGQAVSLQLTVEDGADAPSTSESPGEQSTADEDVDLTDLVDASGNEGSFLDQVTKAFPGAEVVEDE